MRAHPCGSGCGINSKYALPGIQEVCRVSGDLECGKGAGLCVSGYIQQKLRGSVVEDADSAFIR